MSTTADDLPDDVVERAARAMYRTEGSVACELARPRLAALLDAGIVTLVPPPDADAVDAVHRALFEFDEPLGNRGDAEWIVRELHRMGFMVARIADVRPTEPCDKCGGGGMVVDDYERDAQGGPQTVTRQRVCPTCGGSGERPADPQHDHDDCAECDRRLTDGAMIGAMAVQHDHDPDECFRCFEVFSAGCRAVEDETATLPPAGDPEPDPAPRPTEPCETCHGKGEVWHEGRAGHDQYPCSTCNGSGRQPAPHDHDPDECDGWRLQPPQQVEVDGKWWWAVEHFDGEGWGHPAAGWAFTREQAQADFDAACAVWRERARETQR